MGCCASIDDPSALTRELQPLQQCRIPGILDYASQGLLTLPPIPDGVQVSTLLLQNNLLTLLPPGLTLPSLTELDISSNRFVRIPECLKHFVALETLIVSNNPLSRVAGYDEIPNIPRLRALSMAMCSVQKIPSAMVRCQHLATLDVSFNHFVDLSGNELPACTNLTDLNVSNCSLREGLPAGIVNSKSLRMLNISANTLDLSLPHAFGGNLESSLRVLYCNSMQMGAVPTAVVNLTSLVELHVAKNKMISFANFVGVKETKIATVDVSDCELTNIPEGLEALASTLTALDLSLNEDVEILQLSTLLPGLRKLSIISCRFAFKGDGRDEEWFELAKLQKLADIEWCHWGESRRYTGGFIANPYSTRFPLQLCALPLEKINGARVREGLFTGDKIATLKNVLQDGYFKVDFLFEPTALTLHHSIVQVLAQVCVPMHAAVQREPRMGDMLKQRYCFFLFLQALHPDSVLLPPLDVAAVHYAHMCAAPESYYKLCTRLFNFTVDNNYRLVLLDDTERNDLARYAAFWDDEVQHLEQSKGVSLRWLAYSALVDNLTEASRCSSLSGNSHHQNNTTCPRGLAGGGSGRSPEIPSKRGKGAGSRSSPHPRSPPVHSISPTAAPQLSDSNAASPASEETSAGGGVAQNESSHLGDANPLQGPSGHQRSNDSTFSDIVTSGPAFNGSNAAQLLEQIKEVLDVFSLLDPHSKRHVSMNIGALLGQFSAYARNVARYRGALEALGTEVWLRYAKFLTLLALPSPSSDAARDSPVTLNDDDEQQEEQEHQGAATGRNGSVDSWQRRPSAVLSGKLAAPTFSIKDALYLHRTTPIKYNAMLRFLGADVDAAEQSTTTPHTLLAMNERWEALFGEVYLKQSSAVLALLSSEAALSASSSLEGGASGIGGGEQTPPQDSPAIVTASQSGGAQRRRKRVKIATADVALL